MKRDDRSDRKKPRTRFSDDALNVLKLLSAWVVLAAFILGLFFGFSFLLSAPHAEGEPQTPQIIASKNDNPCYTPSDRAAFCTTYDAKQRSWISVDLRALGDMPPRQLCMKDIKYVTCRTANGMQIMPKAITSGICPFVGERPNCDEIRVMKEGAVR